MRKGTLLALLLTLIVSDLAIAGPFRWLRPRNWGRRNRTTYAANNYIETGPVNAVPVSAEIPLGVIQDMHAMDCTYRNNAGLHSLTLHSKLCEVAQAHAENMAYHRNMSHYLGGSPWNRAYAAGWTNSASENIARGYYSVSAAYNGWYHSRGHRLNMLGSHTYCGFGYAVSSSGEPYWAAMYSD